MSRGNFQNTGNSLLPSPPHPTRPPIDANPPQSPCTQPRSRCTHRDPVGRVPRSGAKRSGAVPRRPPQRAPAPALHGQLPAQHTLLHVPMRHLQFSPIPNASFVIALLPELAGKSLAIPGLASNVCTPSGPLRRAAGHCSASLRGTALRGIVEVDAYARTRPVAPRELPGVARRQAAAQHRDAPPLRPQPHSYFPRIPTPPNREIGARQPRTDPL